jgi:uncharacterized protein with PIN domain
MFVDASAIVAILTREPEADTLADAPEGASSPITSPICNLRGGSGYLPEAPCERRRGRRRR